MNAMRLRALIWCLLALLVVIGGIAEFSGRLPIQTNLLALLPPTERNPLAEQAVNQLTDAAGNRAVFLVGHTSPETATKAARAFAKQLREASVFRAVVADIPPVDPRQVTDFYARYRFSLLSDAERTALLEDKSDLDARLQQKLYAPFSFGLTLPVADDPFGLTDTWLSHLPLKNLKLELEDRLLVAREGKKLWVLVSGELAGSAYDGHVQQSVVPAADRAESEVSAAFPGVEVLRTGAIFYAGAARASAEREVDIIGAGSLVGMLALLYVMFRSLRPLALGLLSVGFGIASAVVMTVWMYGELHVITLVFGASLIGEAIDYAIQYFAARLGAGANWEPMTGLRRIAPGLTVALATSLLGYGALMMAPFPALSQIALFALVGLSAAWLTVFLLLPWLMTRPGKLDPEVAVAVPKRFLLQWQTRVTPRACLIAAALLLVVAVPGWFRLHADDDIQLLVSRPAALMAQEEKIRDLTGVGNSSQFFLIEGATADEVLANEEKLANVLTAEIGKGDLSGFQSVSAFVPSRAHQAQSRGAWQEKVFADEAGLRAMLTEAGLRDEVVDRFIAAYADSGESVMQVEDWLKTDFSRPFSYLWLGKTDRGFASVVQLLGVREVAALDKASAGLPGVTFVDKAGNVSRLFHDYRQWGRLWLLGAICLVFGVLCVRYGWRHSLVVLAPTLLAMALAMGVFGYLAAPVTLFNVMALVLVLGVGVNYAIFLREGGVNAAATLAGVLLSAGTTLLSFGLLAFSSMPALAGFGLTLLVGIGIAVLLAPMVLVFCRESSS